jgi:excisionase family DNA binding protein
VERQGISIALPAHAIEAIAERAAEIMATRQSRWLYGDKAAADYLGWPTGRVTKLRQAGELPAHRKGQRCSFHTAELDSYVRGPA